MSLERALPPDTILGDLRGIRYPRRRATLDVSRALPLSHALRRRHRLIGRSRALKPFEDAPASTGRSATGGRDETHDLLAGIGLAGASGAEFAKRNAALLRAAWRMGRVFRLPVPDAPGLAFVGGTAVPEAYGLDPGLFPPANVSGRGLDAEAAFLGCVGEAVEHLSRLEWGTEPREAAGPTLLRELSAETRAALAMGLDDAEWLPAVRLGDERASAVPVDLCLSRARTGAPAPSSAGCAAGRDLAHARLAATLELVERDAAALWWCGGRPARPVSAETLAVALGPIVEQIRRGATGRRTRLLDITTDLAVPVIAAVSVGVDGFGLACGLAARTSAVEAARAAFLELCQMELANRLVALKLEREGSAALAPVEVRHRRRMETIDGETSVILASCGAPRLACSDPAPADAEGRLAFLIERLAQGGVECLCVDLTRPEIGVAAVRVVAPCLQALPVDVRTERLRVALTKHADRACHIHDAALI